MAVADFRHRFKKRKPHLHHIFPAIGQETVVKTTSVPDPISFKIKGQQGKENNIDLPWRYLEPGNRLRNPPLTIPEQGGIGQQVMDELSFSSYLWDGDVLVLSL